MNENVEKKVEVLQIPIEDILPNRFQPRLNFNDQALSDLAGSIKQHGIIQPLLLRKKNDKYEIIAGERRYKAAKMAGLINVPAIISDLDDNASAEVAIVENIQRKDLTAIEEAKSYQALLDKGYMTQEDLARKMGISQSAISNKLRLLTLDNAVQEAVIQEKISERHARTLLKVPKHEEQKKLLDRIINERLTVKQLEDIIKEGDSAMDNSVNKIPDIENMLNNSEDIVPVQKQVEAQVNPDSLFGTPEKIPNKFFNFLEDSAANLNTEEKTMPTFELVYENLDDIELLDDFLPENPVTPDYADTVMDKIKNLNLDQTKCEIVKEEGLNETIISIKVKK